MVEFFSAEMVWRVWRYRSCCNKRYKLVGETQAKNIGGTRKKLYYNTAASGVIFIYDPSMNGEIILYLTICTTGRKLKRHSPQFQENLYKYLTYIYNHENT